MGSLNSLKGISEYFLLIQYNDSISWLRTNKTIVTKSSEGKSPALPPAWPWPAIARLRLGPSFLIRLPQPD
jgi:hypothetical protein